MNHITLPKIIFLTALTATLWHQTMYAENPSMQISYILEHAYVTRVIDGDTIEVSLDDSDEKNKVRLIGINSPETSGRRGRECYGLESSQFATKKLQHSSITMHRDSTQQNRDKYNRLLRYVTMDTGTDFGLSMIRSGYAYEYTYKNPYAQQKLYRSAEKNARIQSLGLWSESTCKGKR